MLVLIDDGHDGIRVIYSAAGLAHYGRHEAVSVSFGVTDDGAVPSSEVPDYDRLVLCDATSLPSIDYVMPRNHSLSYDIVYRRQPLLASQI